MVDHGERNERLVRELCSLPHETEWVEFKHNNDTPDDIGEYISALANSAALARRPNGYLAWGIEDGSHSVVGTTASPHTKRVGNEEIENWLLRALSPQVEFKFQEVFVDEKRVVLLKIPRASSRPIQFKGNEFVRVGSYKKKLKDYPEKEKSLWRTFDQVPFEVGVALEDLDGREVLRLLDHESYFRMLKVDLPDGHAAILAELEHERLIAKSESGRWSITNLGAVLFANRLDDFPSLLRKATRVIIYRGETRFETVREQVGAKGYAAGFEGLISFLNEIVPANEVIGQALRTTVPMYPELALRELTVNALIHQDFFLSGTGPLIEVFDSRVEIINPGRPLMDIQRLLDKQPRSRNEKLAHLMRRLGICEERGSGIDKVVHLVELFQLPAPLFEVPDDSTRVVLFAHRPVQEMDKAERVRACYFHACLKKVNHEYLTNSSLRDRFGIEQRNSSVVSRWIKEAVDDGAICPADEQASRKQMKYVPWWAVTQSRT